MIFVLNIWHLTRERFRHDLFFKNEKLLNTSYLCWLIAYLLLGSVFLVCMHESLNRLG